MPVFKSPAVQQSIRMVSPLWSTLFWLAVGLFGLSNFVTALMGTGPGTIFGVATSRTTVILWNAFLALSCFYFAYRGFAKYSEESDE